LPFQPEHLPIDRDAQRAVERRWRTTLTAGLVPEAVRPVVRDSWIRSLDAAVAPAMVQAPLVLDDAALRQVRQTSDWLGYAEQVLDSHDACEVGDGHVLTVFDPAGRMLASRGHPGVLEGLAEINFRPGGLWSEDVVGTNGPGTALASGRPVHIVGAEHFCERWHPWHCAAVPVRDPATGAIAGALDISGRRESAHPHTLALAGTLAQAIEQLLAANDAHRRVVILRALAAMVSRWPSDGLAAVDRTGAVMGGAGPLPHALQAAVETPAPVRRVLADAVRHAATSGGPIAVRLPIGDGIRAVVHPVLEGGRGVGGCVVVERAQVPTGRQPRDVPPSSAGAARRSTRRGITRYSLEDVVGQSPVVTDALRMARAAAASALPVLVVGESGTGKEVIAQGIHAASARAGGPFVAVNCAALPRDLIESELFGYVGGAFSGARREGQQGKFEAAEGGTIFLDEIAELSPSAQASLLRVLQEGEVTRVGAVYAHPVDVRVIAATNRDVSACVASGQLRQDLYYRLNVLTIPLPTLRERGALDIELLAMEFLRGAAADLDRPVPTLSPGALEALVHHSWPGNVRELKNLMRRTVALADGEIVTRADFPPQLRGIGAVPERVAPIPLADAALPADPARDHLIAVVRSATTMIEAAQRLGVTRSTLYRRMALHGLRPGRALNDGAD